MALRDEIAMLLSPFVTGDDAKAVLNDIMAAVGRERPAASLQQQVGDYIALADTLRGARVYVDTARQAAAHQSLRPVLEHTKAVLAQIDKALNDIGAPPERKEPSNGKAE